MGLLLVLGLKEGLVECATVCVKSWVILSLLQQTMMLLQGPKDPGLPTLMYKFLNIYRILYKIQNRYKLY